MAVVHLRAVRRKNIKRETVESCSWKPPEPVKLDIDQGYKVFSLCLDHLLGKNYITMT